ncbi:LLM class flavin-dependent oxidoreductase, partial [Burkholderia sp. Ax-1720]|nr:LLM class flavin-dependent oxidoreductase [Burkholderia sp. Ax-1720]
MAAAAAQAGCPAVLLSAGPGRPDPWIAAAVLSDALPDLALTIALQAGAILPVAAALRAQSLQSLSGGRLALAVEPDAPGVA